jgi:hypothetical protein
MSWENRIIFTGKSGRAPEIGDGCKFQLWPIDGVHGAKIDLKNVAGSRNGADKQTKWYDGPEFLKPFWRADSSARSRRNSETVD